MQPVNVSAVQAYRVTLLRRRVAVRQEIIRHCRRPGNLRRSRETQHKEVEHQTIELHHEGGELEPADETVRVGVVHVFERDVDVVLGCHVVSDIVVEDEAEQPVEQREVHLG